MKNVTKTNVLFTFTVAFYLLTGFLVRFIPHETLGLNGRLILPELILLVPALLYITFMNPAGLGEISFQLPTGDIHRIVICTFCMMPLISLINTLSTFFVENQVGTVMDSLLVNPMWVSIIVMALVPAVCEEYMFRGLIFNGYKQRNPLGAMFMSALLFGLIHMNVNQFLYAFVMGFLFSLLVYATGTIMSSIIAHFVFNAYNVISAYAFADILKVMQETDYTTSESDVAVSLTAMDYVISYAIVLGIVLLGVWIAKKEFRKICNSYKGVDSVMSIFSKENRRNYRNDEGRFFDGYIMVGIILCIAYMVIYGL